MQRREALVGAFVALPVVVLVEARVAPAVAGVAPEVVAEGELEVVVEGELEVVAEEELEVVVVVGVAAPLRSTSFPQYL